MIEDYLELSNKYNASKSCYDSLCDHIRSRLNDKYDLSLDKQSHKAEILLMLLSGERLKNYSRRGSITGFKQGDGRAYNISIQDKYWKGYDFRYNASSEWVVYPVEYYKPSPKVIRERWIERLTSVWDRKIETDLAKYTKYLSGLSGVKLFEEMKPKDSKLITADFEITNWVYQRINR